MRTQQEMDRQLQEIEAIKDQRIELKQQRTRLQIDMVCLPENRIRDAPLIRELYDALRDMQRDKKNSRAADDVRDLQKELADLQSTQRKFIAELDAKQVDEIKEQQKGLWKLDKDLNQVRGQRDALQVQADEFKAYGNSVRASTAEVKLIADTRKVRFFSWPSFLSVLMCVVLLGTCGNHGIRVVSITTEKYCHDRRSCLVCACKKFTW